MTENYTQPWTTAELTESLLNGTALPGPTGPYDYLYHRSTAAHWLNEQAKDCMKSFMEYFGAIL